MEWARPFRLRLGAIREGACDPPYAERAEALPSDALGAGPHFGSSLVMELGVYTFADLGVGPDGTGGIAPAQRLRNLMEEMELADQLGLDVFGVGEHHRPDFAVSSPVVALAAGAERTKRIRLTSAVTVLSSADPVR